MKRLKIAQASEKLPENSKKAKQGNKCCKTHRKSGYVRLFDKRKKNDMY